MIDSAVKVSTNIEFNDRLNEKKKGATVLGNPISLEIGEYVDKVIADADRQRMISMFFQQKALEEALMDASDADFEVDFE